MTRIPFHAGSGGGTFDGRAGRLGRRFSLGLLVGAAFALASAPTAAAQEQLAASCEPPIENTRGIGGFSFGVSQDFTASQSGSLTRAEIALNRDAGTDEPFIVQIRTVDSAGVPTDVVLATGTIPAANVPEAPADPALVGVVFTSPATVVAGQRYAIVVLRADGTAGVRVDETDPVGEDCPGTFKFALDAAGSTWLQTTPQLDLVFRVFVTPAATAATCKGRPATIVGTAGADLLTGTDGPDVIAALDGDDEVLALGGDDIVCGNTGKDRLLGQDGEDLLKGNRGNDTEKGGAGDDRLKGNRGADLLKGKGGEDFLGGGKGNDTCRGGEGDDKRKSC